MGFTKRNKVSADFNMSSLTDIVFLLLIFFMLTSNVVNPTEILSKDAAMEEGVVANTRFFQADAENTKLPDNSIDVIVCSGMLHHLDLSYALPELRRILKPGGKILAGEALDYNPAIKLYRMITPAMRTDWEKAHILDLSDVRFATRFLDLHKIRYWHVFGYIGGKVPVLFPFFVAVDIFLEKIPYIQRMAWIFTFELHKKLD